MGNLKVNGNISNNLTFYTADQSNAKVDYHLDSENKCNGSIHGTIHNSMESRGEIRIQALAVKPIMIACFSFNSL